MAKLSLSDAVYNPQADPMNANASVEDKIVMYSAALYDYTRECATSSVVRSPLTRFLTVGASDRLWMQARRQAEREAAARSSRLSNMSAANKRSTHTSVHA